MEKGREGLPPARFRAACAILGSSSAFPMLRPGLAGSSLGHHRRDLREDGADAGGNVGHDGARSDRHETGHQRVFDKVLTTRILPDSQLPNQVHNVLHADYLSLQRAVLFSFEITVTLGWGGKNQRNSLDDCLIHLTATRERFEEYYFPANGDINTTRAERVKSTFRPRESNRFCKPTSWQQPPSSQN